MKKAKSLFKFLVISVLAVFSAGRAHSSQPSNLSEIDIRILKIREAIKSDLKNKAATDISVNLNTFTHNTDWVNWGNWGNWSNWNNWVKWNDWNNWNNWNDFSNWQKFSNY